MIIITEKVTNVQELVITEEILYGTVMKRKTGLLPESMEYQTFIGKSLEVHGVHCSDVLICGSNNRMKYQNG